MKQRWSRLLPAAFMLVVALCAALLCGTALADYEVVDGVAEVTSFEDFQTAAADVNVSKIVIADDFVIEEDCEVENKAIVVVAGQDIHLADNATLTHITTDPAPGGFSFEDLDPSDPDNYYRFASSNTCFLVFRQYGDGAWHRKICGNGASIKNLNLEIEGYYLLCAALNGNVELDSVPTSNLFVYPDSEGFCSLTVPSRTALNED